MEHLDSSQIAIDLASRIAQGQNAADIADAIVSSWKNIDLALAKVVGRQGIDAMFRRSLFLTAPTASWRLATPYDLQSVSDLSELRAFLASRPLPDAASAGAALLHTFYESLANLIGRSLAERLLRPALTASLSPTSVQDLSS